METLKQYPNVLNFLRLCTSLALLMAIFIPLERLFSLHRQRIFRKGFGADVAYYFLTGVLPKLLFTLPLSLLAGGLHRVYPNAFYEAIARLPSMVRLFAAVVVGEVGYYWAHRLAHEIPFLWRFHAIHHSPEEIDWLVNTRSHPVDALFTRLCGQLPLYFLGLAQPAGQSLDWVPFFMPMFGAIWGFFIHSNVGWRLGWLEHLVSTPGFHHWHHTNDGPDVINKNYSTLFPWVDKLFGTFYLPQEWPGSYGIDEKMPDDLGRQILRPLLRPRPDQDLEIAKDFPVTGD